MNICEEDFIDHRNDHNPTLDSNNSVNDAKVHLCFTIKSLHDILEYMLQNNYNPNMQIFLSKENQICNEAITIIEDPNGVLLLSSVPIENMLSNMNDEQGKIYKRNIKVHEPQFKQDYINDSVMIGNVNDENIISYPKYEGISE